MIAALIILVLCGVCGSAGFYIGLGSGIAACEAEHERRQRFAAAAVAEQKRLERAAERTQRLNDLGAMWRNGDVIDLRGGDCNG